jgi:hypothetical protein
MALAVIGGSNFLSRYLISNLAANYTRIALGDFYPQRQSVYALQASLGNKLTKRHLSFRLDLEHTLEGADEVWVVTHDYFKLAFAKTFYLEQTARLAKSLGAKKLKVIAPLELDHLDPVLGDPSALAEESISKAREHFPDLSVIKTNLIFGDSAMSLIFQHTIDQLNSHTSIVSRKLGKTKFQPVHQSVILQAVQSAKPGDSAVLAGPEVLSWEEITKVLADYSVAGAPGHSSILHSLKASLATSKLGDAVYPSHIVQFYRLLEQDRVPTPTVTSGPKLTESLLPGKYHGEDAKAWHSVIVD